MAEKEVRIGLRTDLKGTGLQDAGKQLDNIGNKATTAARSLDAMEAEARDLQRALNAMEPGTVEFQRTAENLGKVRAEMAQTVDLADSFATKANGAAGGVKNLGMYAQNAGYQIQDFFVQVAGGQSIMTAAAQQGSQLAGMFGPGGAFIGVGLALAAVLAKVIAIKSETEGGKAFKGLSDSFEEIAENSSKLIDQRKDIEGSSIEDVFNQENIAIDRQTKAFLANIDAMKKRILAEGALDKINTGTALSVIDGKLATGSISATDAASQKAAIEQAAKQRELQRSMELSKLNEEVAKAEEAKAKAQKTAAERQLTAAQEALAASDAVIKWLQDRKNLTKQLGEQSKEYLGDPSKIFDYGAGDIAEQRELNQANARDQSAEKTAGIDAMFAGLQRLLQMGGMPDADVIKGLQQKNGELLDAFSNAKTAVEDATNRLTDATDARETAEQSGEAERGALSDEAAAEGIRTGLENAQGEYERLGEQAGIELSKVFESWVNSLGAQAEQGKPGELIERVRKMLADGVQGGEDEKIQAIVTEIARHLTQNTAQTVQGFTKILNTIAGLRSQLAAVIRRLNAMEQAGKEAAKDKK